MGIVIYALIGGVRLTGAVFYKASGLFQTVNVSLIDDSNGESIPFHFFFQRMDMKRFLK